RARLKHKDGSWRHVEGVFTNLLADKNVNAIVGNYRDVSERRKLEEELAEAQKLESIGRLAGGVAHDFNNILTAIMGYSELAARHIPPASDVQDDLRQVQQAADRAATLTGQLLSFARRQIIEPQVVDLNELILNLNKMVCRLIGEDIDLVVLPGKD